MPFKLKKATRKLLCIEQMGDCFERFEAIAPHYAQDLDKGNAINKTLWTLHDFSHHCCNIYKVISNILLKNSFNSKNALTEEELFVLNVSVLFHDMSMSREMNFDRNSHSRVSADYLESEYKPNSMLERNLTINQKDAAKLIIAAHSDIKDKNGTIIEKTLENKKLTNEMSGSDYNIRAKLLAGLLRLADELDVTNNRVGEDTHFYNQLPDDNPSKNHWRSLMCFNQIRQNNDILSILELVVDDNYIEKHISDLENSADRINKVKNKVQREYDYIYKEVFSKDELAVSCIVFRDIEIKTNLSELKELLSKHEHISNDTRDAGYNSKTQSGNSVNTDLDNPKASRIHPQISDAAAPDGTCFNISNIRKRLFFISGRTQDSFCQNNIIVTDLTYILNEHLIDAGYKRVIFYGKQKLYFFNDESYELTLSSTGKIAGKLESNKERVDAGVFTERSNGNGYHLPSDDIHTFNRDKRSVGETGEASCVSPLHMGKMPDRDVFDTINLCMKDHGVNTAVVITNADEFIRSFGKGDDELLYKICDSFNEYVSWTEHHTKNIIIFIFPQGEPREKSELYEGKYILWDSCIKPKLDKGAASITIGPPMAGEIKNALHYVRLKYGLSFDYNKLDIMCGKIAEDYSAENKQLNELLRILKSFAAKKKMLNLNTLDELIGIKHTSDF